MSRRIAHLENYFDPSNCTVTRWPDNNTVSESLIQGSASTNMQQGDDELQVQFQFEKDLLTSRVYRTARAQNSDISFRSSIGISHAWTALSDISLSEITNISVIALPIYWYELSNHQHYEFRHSMAVYESTSVMDQASTIRRISEIDTRSLATTIDRPDSAMSSDFRSSSYNPAILSSIRSARTGLLVAVDGGEPGHTRGLSDSVSLKKGITLSTLTCSSAQPKRPSMGTCRPENIKSHTIMHTTRHSTANSPISTSEDSYAVHTNYSRPKTAICSCLSTTLRRSSLLAGCANTMM